jgi:uncharacterized integral membrane protein
MRFFWFLVFAALAGAVGLFAYQNQADVSVRFWDRSLTTPLALLVGAVYVLGMLTGWTVLGIFRRSLRHMTEAERRQHAGSV